MGCAGDEVGEVEVDLDSPRSCAAVVEQGLMPETDDGGAATTETHSLQSSPWELVPASRSSIAAI